MVAFDSMLSAWGGIAHEQAVDLKLWVAVFPGWSVWLDDQTDRSSPVNFDLDRAIDASRGEELEMIETRQSAPNCLELDRSLARYCLDQVDDSALCRPPSQQGYLGPSAPGALTVCSLDGHVVWAS